MVWNIGLYTERMLGQLSVLEQVNPEVVVECMICDGSAHPECGCDGTMTVLAAIRHINIELEILSK